MEREKAYFLMVGEGMLYYRAEQVFGFEHLVFDMSVRRPNGNVKYVVGCLSLSFQR